MSYAMCILLTMSIMLLGFLTWDRRKLVQDKKRLESECTAYVDTIDTYREREELQERKAQYELGLYIGRTTDGLYRQFLEKVSRNEQAVIMMNGSKEEQENA